MDLSRYTSLFVDESKENLQRLSVCLLNLENQPEDKDILNEIFRIAHTIKGMAATLAYNDITNLTHQMENLLDVLRSGKKKVDRNVIDILFSCLDSLEILVDNVLSNNPKSIDTESLLNEIIKIIGKEEKETTDLVQELIKIANVSPKEEQKEINDIKKNIYPEEFKSIDWCSKYDEEESKLIAQSGKEGKNCIEVNVKLMPDCQMKSIRVTLILRKIEENSEIIKTFPPYEELLAEKFENEFSVALITTLSENQIKNDILSISEVESVTTLNLLSETSIFVKPEIEEEDVISEFVLPEFNEYERLLINEAHKMNLNIIVLGIHLFKGVLLKATRVTVILRALENLGEIIKTVPTISDLEDEKFGNYFQVVLITNETSQKVINTLLSIAEVRDSVDIAHVTIEDNITSTSSKSLELKIPKIEPKSEPKIEPKSEPKIEPKSEPKPEFIKTDKTISPKQQVKIVQTVRVDTDKLDNLMTLVGELVISRSQLNQISNNLNIPSLIQAVDKMTNIINDLQNVAMKLRMVPVEQVFNRFPRMVRDLSRTLNKDIEIIITGHETELDRTLIDEIGDPLVHLIRNAADHGLETPEERIKKGKNKVGKIELIARHDGNNVLIIVKDDGRGINISKIKQKAIEKGIITPEQSLKMTDEYARQLIFAPGFSTAETTTNISGRGVGLDAVKHKIDSIGGTIDFNSISGLGSTVTIKLPLTLAIMPVLLTEVSNEIYAIPLVNVEEVKEITNEELKTIQNCKVIVIRNHTIPLTDLGKVLSVPGRNGERDLNNYLSIVIVKVGEKKTGIIVDELIGQEEIVIKPLSKSIKNSNYISGAATLGDGRIALILNTSSLL